MNNSAQIVIGACAVDLIYQFGRIQKELQNLDRFDDHYNREFRFGLRKDDYHRLIGEVIKERIMLTPGASLTICPGLKYPGETEYDLLIITRNVFCNGLLDIHQIAPCIRQTSTD